MGKITALIIGCLLACNTTFAKELDAEYAVSFGIFGKMGVSHAHFQSDARSYTITIDAAATGMAKTLSRNRIEKHVSKGFVKNGRLYAKTYTVMISYGDKRKEKKYVIDHALKKITKTIRKYQEGKLVSQSSERLPFFGSDDLLTLYFNLPLLMDQNPKPGLYRFKAAGAENQHGTVDVHIPEAKELAAYQNMLGVGNYRYVTTVIHQKIFSSAKGELLISIGEDGITQNAVLKDLLMFGDLRAERIK